MEGGTQESESITGGTRHPLMDEEGNPVVLSLDIKSVKPYRTQDEYLYAMKEDLAEWFNALYDVVMGVDDFFEQLETGVVLCQHANALQDFVAKQAEGGGGGNTTAVQGPHRRNNNRYPIQLPASGVVFRSRVQPGTFQSRDNISNFIAWCRCVLGIPNTLLFETEDLVSRKNERNVVLCILEVARRGASYGMLAPRLVQFEEEIEAEMAQDAEGGVDEGGLDSKAAAAAAAVERRGRDRPGKDLNLQQQSLAASSKRQKPWIEVDMMSLDEMVRLILSECTCEHQFPMVRISEGKYRYGDSQSLIFLRILRNHVMVRIGGGWDTLECFLDRYDPCRCKSKEHRGTLAFAAKSTPGQSSDFAKKSNTSLASPTSTEPSSTHSSYQELPHSCKSSSPKKTSSAAEISSEEKSDPSKINNPDRDSTRRSKPPNPLHSTKQLDSGTDSKRSSVPDIRTMSAEPRRGSTPTAVAPPGERCQPSDGHNEGQGRGRSQGHGQGHGQGQARQGNVRLVSAVKRSDVRPSSASPSLTRANRAFRSSGDLLAASSSSRNQRFSMPREERGPSKTGSTSSVERPGGAGRVLRSSAAAVGSLKSADGTMRRSSSMDSTKLLLLAGGRVGSRSVTAAGAAAASPGGLQRLQDRARKMSPKAVAVAATSRSGGADKRRNDPWKKNQTRRGSSGSPAQGLNNSVRLGLAGDRLLPGGRNRRRPGDDVRSSSVDASPTDETKSLRGEEDRDDRVRSGSLQPSASLTLLRVDGFLSRLPSPDYDDDLNARMELVYQQYKNDQLGVTSGVEFKGFDAKKKTTSSQLQRDGIGGRRSGTVTPHHPRKDGVVVPLSKSSSPWTAKRPAAAAAASPLDRDRSSGKAGSVVGSPDRAGISSSSSRGGSPEARGRGGSSRAIDWHDTAAAATADRNLCSKSLGDISDRHFVIKATEQNITPDTIDDADLSRAAKPRKDDRLGPPTRIPLPVGAPGDLREQSDQSPTSSSLTRFDSGVDITNVSPTFDGGGFSIGEAYDAASTCRQNPSLVGVQCAEACSLSEQRLAYVAPPTVSEEEFY